MRRMVRTSTCPRARAVQLLCAALIAGLARPPAALAAPATPLPLLLASASPRVAVVVVPLDARAAQYRGELEGAAEAALSRAGRFTVAPGMDAWNPTAAAARRARAEDALTQVKVGKVALEELDAERAAAAFSAAVAAWKEADLSRDLPSLLEAWTMKAAAFATAGDNAAAKKDMEAVVSLNPRAEFSPTYFPPELIKFAEAQRKQAANAKGELLVRTEPSGARVWVDGTYRGVSPVTVAGLTAARHLVVASLGGHALAQVEAAPGETSLLLEPAELSQAWVAATTLVSRDADGPTRDQAAQQLGRAAQLDQVLLVIARKSLAGEQLDLTALRLEVRDQHNAAYRGATVSPGDAAQVAAFFDALTAADAPRDGKAPVRHVRGSDGAPLQRIAGWSLLGVGAVALVTAGVFGFMASERAAAFRATPQVQTFQSEQLRSQGQLFAGVADVSLVVGLASAAGGGVLTFLQRGEAGTPAPERRAPPAPAPPAEGAPPPSKQELQAPERQQREDEARRQREVAQQAEDEKKRAEDEKKRAAEEAKAAKQSKGQRAQAEQKAREAEAAKKAEEEAARLKEEEEKKRREEEEKKRRAEEERKRKEAEEKKRREAEDHDDLRNF